MMKRFVAVALLIGGAFASLGVAQDKASNPDDRIVDQVRIKLVGDQDVKGGALDVTSKDGIVTIKGRVDSGRGKSKATHLAKKVKGVKEVDNELVVGPPTE